MNKAKLSFLQIKVFSNYCKFENLKAAEAIRRKIFAAQKFFLHRQKKGSLISINLRITSMAN